jgi:hypothetical protein
MLKMIIVQLHEKILQPLVLSEGEIIEVEEMVDELIEEDKY